MQIIGKLPQRKQSCMRLNLPILDMNERKISQVSADSFLSHGTMESEDFAKMVHQEEPDTVS